MQLPAGPSRTRARTLGACSDGLAPGASTTNKLVFQVPAGDEPRRLDVWNGDEPGDILGRTRIAVRL
jgi:hypothetical protein